VGSGLLTITYLLVRHFSGHVSLLRYGPVTYAHSAHGPAAGLPQLPPLARLQQGDLTRQHASDLHELLVWSLVTLAAMALASVALGGLVAGRVLGPVWTMTAAARRISHESEACLSTDVCSRVLLAASRRTRERRHGEVLNDHSRVRSCEDARGLAGAIVAHGLQARVELRESEPRQAIPSRAVRGRQCNRDASVHAHRACRSPGTSLRGLVLHDEPVAPKFVDLQDHLSDERVGRQRPVVEDIDVSQPSERVNWPPPSRPFPEQRAAGRGAPSS